MNENITRQDDKYNHHLKGMSDYWRDRERSLIKLLLKKKTTVREIADAIGCTKAAISLHYNITQLRKEVMGGVA